MTFRTHLITGDPILFAPERAARPHAFLNDDRKAQRCPFCPGHEGDTPPPVVVVGDPWRVRVVPNKYPSVEGAEVIVESRQHDDSFDRLANADEVVAVYVDRYRAHANAAYTALFKNHGADAGASIPHAHSQLMPLPFVPPRIEREGNAFARTAECPLCAAIESHRRDGLMIRETDGFAWLAPSASSMPYQQWIVPKEHAPELSTLDASRIAELALLLRAASERMLTICDSFNWLFLIFPCEASAHWYVELFPRLTTIAGFELSTGTFVEIMDPAAAARQLAWPEVMST
jgi:UDPglucose--hexose-1-phosphate uridylyltransferase